MQNWLLRCSLNAEVTTYVRRKRNRGGGGSKNGLKLRTGHSRLTKERLNNTHVSVQQKDVYTTTVCELGGLFNVVQGATPDEVQIRLNLRSVHAKKKNNDNKIKMGRGTKTPSPSNL